MIQIYNEDCLKAMKEMPNDSFDLAICDPPYGIHEKLKTTEKKRNGNAFAVEYMKKQWDKNRPSKEYFDQLLRVSKNQVIWGGNYFADLLPPSRGWICWDKVLDNFTSVNHELAWTSFDKALKMFRRDHGKNHGFMLRRPEDQKIHPTQKPIALYNWILSHYAKEGWKILDTHLGSGSIAIACHNMNYDLTAFEIDSEYYEAALNRLQNHQKQLKLF